jgi:hypothetical protein
MTEPADRQPPKTLDENLELHPNYPRVVFESANLKLDEHLIAELMEKGWEVALRGAPNPVPDDYWKLPQVITTANRYEGVQQVVGFIIHNNPSRIPD